MTSSAKAAPSNMPKQNGQFRKQRRKAFRKQKKVNKAISYARNKNTDKVCINTNDIAKVKFLNTSTNLLSTLQGKFFCNKTKENFEPQTRRSKKKKKGKRKDKNQRVIENVTNFSENNIRESSLHFSQSGSNLRMAKLQEYINKEVKQSNKKNACKVKENLHHEENLGNLIKDKQKLKNLRDDQKEDVKEINRLARSLKLHTRHKKQLFPIFEEHFGDILKDIEEGTMANASSYEDKLCDSDSSENEEALEEDINIVMDDDQKVSSNGNFDDDNVIGSCHTIVPKGTIVLKSVNTLSTVKDKHLREKKLVRKSSASSFSDDFNDDNILCNSNVKTSPDKLKRKNDLKLKIINGIEDNLTEIKNATSVTGIAVLPTKKSSSKKSAKSKLKNNLKQEKPNINDKNVRQSARDCFLEEFSEEESYSANSFLDNEAVEDNESEEEVEMSNEDIAFESGSSFTNNGLHDNVFTINNIFDLYLSNSEVEDSDLDGFIVDDDYVEYDSSEDSLMEEMKRKTKPKNESGIIKDNKEKKIKSDQLNNVNKSDSCKLNNRKRCRILSNSSDESPAKNIQTQSKRNRILSDSCDEFSNDQTSVKTIKKKAKKEGKQLYIDNSNSNSQEINKKTKKGKKKKVQFSLPNENDEAAYSDLPISNKNDLLKSNVKVTEDIYGRFRDEKGNIIETSINNKGKDGKYIPPALRKLMELNVGERKKELLADLGKKLKGLLNRLAESNLAGIVSQIEKLYQTNSRNDMNDTLIKLMFEIIVTPVFTPERLVQEHALLIAILSANVGAEVGAHLLTEFICKFMEEWDAYHPSTSSSEIESKELENLLLFITQLYNFKVVDVSLIYDILRNLLENYNSKAVELILLVLRSVGFTLRKDDPLALKHLITEIKNKSEQEKPQLTDSTFSKVSFMLEILMAIRNNNMNKVPNYDPTHGEHLKSLMKGVVRKGCHSSDLKISLEDIVKSKTCGRWWVIGSAWSGGLKENSTIEDNNFKINKAHFSALSSSENYSDAFKKKAKKFKLSRPPRINILFAMTEGCEDDLDAFQKLIQLSLPPNQESEIFNVMLICNEKYKYFNNFYVMLALRLISYKKSFQRTLQFCLWDKFDDLNRLNNKEIVNLAAFVANLIAEDGMYLSLFKKLDFTSVNETMVSFLRKCLIKILLHPQGNYVIQRAFNRLVEQPKLKLLRQCIKIFILKFVKPKKIEENKQKALLASKVQYALDILNSTGGVRL